MGKCFVIQPFDHGAFDERYDQIFVPAIKKADLEPYRVDRDPSASIPILDIEKGIADSAICLADISMDNPNVWFELGYAIAVQKEVILVCNQERKKFPFDVQHRNIIEYKTASPQDFVSLEDSIIKRIVAVMNKEKEIAKFTSSSPVAEMAGLSQHEMVALVIVMQNQFSEMDTVPSGRISVDMNKAGFTAIAVTMGLRGLTRKGLLESGLESDMNGNSYSVYKVTPMGEDWLFKNEEKLTLKETPVEIQPNTKDPLPF